MLATFLFKVVSWFSGTGAPPASEEDDIKETILRFGVFTWWCLWGLCSTFLSIFVSITSSSYSLHQ